MFDWISYFIVLHSNITGWFLSKFYLLEILTVFQLVKKFPAFYGTRRFITAFTSAHHLSLSWASSIQPIHPHPTSWRSILVLSFHLCLGLSSGLLPFGFPTKTLCTPLLSPIHATTIVSYLSKTSLFLIRRPEVFTYQHYPSERFAFDCVSPTHSPGVRRPSLETDHFPPSSPEAKSPCGSTSSASCTFMAWWMIKYR